MYLDFLSSRTFAWCEHSVACSAVEMRRGAHDVLQRRESLTAKRKNRSRHRTGQGPSGAIAKWRQGTLRSYSVGALPIINRLLERMNLEGRRICSL
jgi:hypothetical protein